MFNHNIINVFIHDISDKVTYVDIVVKNILPVSYTKVVFLRILKRETAFKTHLQGLPLGEISIGSQKY